jgi:hypothetical protein
MGLAVYQIVSTVSKVFGYPPGNVCATFEERCLITVCFGVYASFSVGDSGVVFSFHCQARPAFFFCYT